MPQRGYKRKYKPRKEMSLAELKRMVAKGHQIMREKRGLPNVKRKWNAAPVRTRPRNRGMDGEIENL
jgi:hypothetical protein